MMKGDERELIYVTGDCHAKFHKFNTESFPEQKVMTKSDVVIIAGDFGGVWDYRGETRSEKYWLNWLNSKPFTTVFVDGNHENFNRLYEYPVKEWHGGKVHEIRPSVLHLMRGEVFDIEGIKIFAFGGASSHDISDGILDWDKDRELINKWSRDPYRLFRVRNMSWWEQELPTQEEMGHGWDVLEDNNYKVDYIITHSPASNLLSAMGYGASRRDVLTKYLQEVINKVEYKKFIFGHLHEDRQLDQKHICLYDQIIRIT